MLNISPIRNIVRKFVSKSKPAVQTVAAETVKETAPKTETKVADEAVPFCHQYWQYMKDTRQLRPLHSDCVSQHGQLNGINHHFINSPYPNNMGEKLPFNDLSPREMITMTDIEFKRLKPLEEPMTVYSCIGKKPDFFKESKLFKKRWDMKKGDIIDMKEYAYATSDINYAKGYLPNNEGILYEIEIPKGARVSRTGDFGKTDEVVTPRSSRYECLGTEHIKDENSDYKKIKLRLILPEEV